MDTHRPCNCYWLMEQLLAPLMLKDSHLRDGPRIKATPPLHDCFSRLKRESWDLLKCLHLYRK